MQKNFKKIFKNEPMLFTFLFAKISAEILGVEFRRTCMTKYTDDYGKRGMFENKKFRGFQFDDYEISLIKTPDVKGVFDVYEMVEDSSYIERVPGVKRLRGMLEVPVDVTCLGVLQYAKEFERYKHAYNLSINVAVRDYFSQEQMLIVGKMFKNSFQDANVSVIPDSTCVAAETAVTFGPNTHINMSVVNYTGKIVTSSRYEIKVDFDSYYLTEKDNLKNELEKISNDIIEAQSKKSSEGNIEVEKDSNEKDEEGENNDENTVGVNKEEGDKDVDITELYRQKELIEEKLKKLQPKFVRSVKFIESEVVEGAISDKQIEDVVMRHLALQIKEMFRGNGINVSIISYEPITEEFFCDLNEFVRPIISSLPYDIAVYEALEIYCYGVADPEEKRVLVNVNIPLKPIREELRSMYKLVEEPEDFLVKRLSRIHERNDFFEETVEYADVSKVIQSGAVNITKKDFVVIDNRITIPNIDNLYSGVFDEIKLIKEALSMVDNKDTYLEEIAKFKDSAEYIDVEAAYQGYDGSLDTLKRLYYTIVQMRKYTKQKLVEEMELQSQLNVFTRMVNSVPLKNKDIMDRIAVEYTNAKNYIDKNEFTAEGVRKMEMALRVAINKARNQKELEEKQKKETEAPHKKEDHKDPEEYIDEKDAGDKESQKDKETKDQKSFEEEEEEEDGVSYSKDEKKFAEPNEEIKNNSYDSKNSFEGKEQQFFDEKFDFENILKDENMKNMFGEDFYQKMTNLNKKMQNSKKKINDKKDVL